MAKLLSTASDHRVVQKWLPEIDRLYQINKDQIYFKSVDSEKVLIALSDFSRNMIPLIYLYQKEGKNLSSISYILDQKNWTVLTRMKNPDSIEAQVRLGISYAYVADENHYRSSVLA